MGKLFDVPTEPLSRIFNALENAKFLVETRGESLTFVPARDFESIRVTEVLAVVRTDEEKPQVHASRIQSVPIIDDIMQRIYDVVRVELRELTIKDLVMFESCQTVLTEDTQTRCTAQDSYNEGA